MSKCRLVDDPHLHMHLRVTIPTTWVVNLQPRTRKILLVSLLVVGMEISLALGLLVDGLGGLFLGLEAGLTFLVGSLKGCSR